MPWPFRNRSPEPQHITEEQAQRLREALKQNGGSISAEQLIEVLR